MKKKELWKNIVILIIAFLFFDLFVLKRSVVHAVIIIIAYIGASLILRFFLISISKKYKLKLFSPRKEMMVTTKCLFGAASIFMGILILVFGINAFIKNPKLTELVMLMVGIFLIMFGIILMYYSFKFYKRLDIKKKMYSIYLIVFGSLFLMFGVVGHIKEIGRGFIFTLIMVGIIFLILGFVIRPKK